AAQTVVVKPSAGSIYFTVDAAVPNWLLVSPDNGSPTSTSGTTLSLSASPYAASLGSGQYSGTVTLHSSGLADATITVTLVVKSAAATIASSPSTVNITNWVAGTSLPTQTLLVQSSGDPVTFSVAPKYTSPTTAWFTISTSSYIAYSWHDAHLQLRAIGVRQRHHRKVSHRFHRNHAFQRERAHNRQRHRRRRRSHRNGNQRETAKASSGH